MTRVTLLVDALEPNPGGIGRYTWELCKGLPSHELDVQFFGRHRLLANPEVLLEGGPLPRRRNIVRRWRDIRAIRKTIIHGPNYFLPPFAETGIITVHDLSVFRFPETHPAERVSAFEREFHRSLDRAAHVLTDTATIRSELIETFGLPPDRVTAIPLGVDAAFQPVSAVQAKPALAAWGLEQGGYGLCVSTLEPRKKISELLSAWRRLPRALRDSHPLVLCGGKGWRNQQLRNEIEEAVKEGWLRNLGFVEEAVLPQLFAGAALFIYPSIYEGFGLPPLEAMACGAPVLVSNRSCLPEVCGEAARYLDPDDADAFVAALVQNLTDATWRQDAVRRGAEHASHYRWERCIERTVEIYRTLSG